MELRFYVTDAHDKQTVVFQKPCDI